MSITVAIAWLQSYGEDDVTITARYTLRSLTDLSATFCLQYSLKFTLLCFLKAWQVLVLISDQYQLSSFTRCAPRG